MELEEIGLGARGGPPWSEMGLGIRGKRVGAFGTMLREGVHLDKESRLL